MRSRIIRVLRCMAVLLLVLAGSTAPTASAATGATATVAYGTDNRTLTGTFDCTTATSGDTYWKIIRRWKVNGVTQESSEVYMNNVTSYSSGTLTWTWWDDFEQGMSVRTESACYYSRNGIANYDTPYIFTTSPLTYPASAGALIENLGGGSLAFKCYYTTGPEDVASDVWIITLEVKKNGFSYSPPISGGVLVYTSNTSDMTYITKDLSNDLTWMEGDTLELDCGVYYDTPSISPVEKDFDFELFP